MAASAYAGLVLVGGDDDTRLVAVAARDLPAGLEVQAGDVVMAEVPADRWAEYLAEVPPSSELSRPVGAGEFIPRDAVVGAEDGQRLVAVPVALERMPPELERGTQIDVWSADGVEPVLHRANVVRVARPDEWSGATATIVVSVAAGDVSGLLRAIRGGSVDVTAYAGTT